MFSRRFMQTLKVRKYGNPSAYLGSVSTNFAFVSPLDKIVSRYGMYILCSFLMISATRDFSFLYEIYYHLPQPSSHTYYQSNVPHQIRQSNKQVIQNWKKLNQVKKLLQTYDIEV